jgi:hypothetical protein
MNRQAVPAHSRVGGVCRARGDEPFQGETLDWLWLRSPRQNKRLMIFLAVISIMSPRAILYILESPLIPGADDEPDDDTKLTDKLKQMTRAMVLADPSLSEEQHLYSLLHSAHGRALAQHLNTLSKRKEEQPMPQVDIFKLSNIQSIVEIAKAITKGDANDISEMDFTRMLQGHAALTKRDGESVDAAFERILLAPENTELRKAYRLTKGQASLEVTSVEVGSSSVVDDSAKAVQLLQEMADRQRRSFADVFQDPANKALAGRTYTSAHRPTASSTSGSELRDEFSFATLHTGPGSRRDGWREKQVLSYPMFPGKVFKVIPIPACAVGGRAGKTNATASEVLDGCNSPVSLPPRTGAGTFCDARRRSPR